MTDNDTLLARREKNIVFLTLNRPHQRNALSMALFHALDRQASLLRRDRALRAVIINGAGVDFCAGLDLKSIMHNPRNGLRLLRKWLPGNANLAQRVSAAWRRIPAPVIFALHGRCWGGGLQIALGGDFRIAHPESSLAIMESRWGLIPDMAGNLALRELLSKDRAMRWAMTAEEIDPPTALEHGLLTEVSDQPLASATALAETIANRSPDAVAAIKRLYQRHWFSSKRRLLAAETLAQLKMFQSQNRTIAVKRETGQPNEPYRARGK